MLDQIQGDASVVEVRACSTVSDTSVTKSSSYQQTRGRAGLHKTIASRSIKVESDSRMAKTRIGQPEKETRAIQMGLDNMEQCRSAEHRTIRDLLVVVGESQARLENRLGYIETDSPSPSEPTVRQSKTPRIAFSSTSLQSREQATGRLWKNVYWKWSIYRLPIGVLSIESSHETSSQPSDSESCPEDRTLVTFTFSPPKWICSSLINVCYAMSTEGHVLPYWQRTQSGAVSILPPKFAEYLGDNDLMALGGLLSGLSYREVCDLDAYFARGISASRDVSLFRAVPELGKRAHLTNDFPIIVCWTHWRFSFFIICDGKQLPLMFVLLPYELRLSKDSLLTYRATFAQDNIGTPPRVSELQPLT